jgi:hypothetical protein
MGIHDSQSLVGYQTAVKQEQITERRVIGIILADNPHP